jgi:tetratricopeptide (TPR) repeat protein
VSAEQHSGSASRSLGQSRSRVKSVGVLLGLGLAAGATISLRLLDEARRPEVLAFQAIMQAPPHVPKAVALSIEAVRRDSANPYRWSDLGGALAAANDLARARYCYQRALDLSRDVPAIRLRDANFHFQIDEPHEGLVSAARVLRTVADYDSTLFNYFDRVIPNPAEILAQIGGDRRASLAYTEHLLRIGNLEGATEGWRWCSERGFKDQRLTAAYVDALLTGHRYEQAQRAWADSLGEARGDFPAKNLLFNGSFEEEPSGVALDWRIRPSEEFETVRDKSFAKQGQWSLALHFRGTANVSYAHVEQLVIVTPGLHSLQAWIRTDGITTDQGPRFEIVDAESPARLDLRTGGWTGSHDWTLVNQSFAVPAGTHLIAARIVRQPSESFDNRIKGSLWVDGVRLVQER